MGIFVLYSTKSPFSALPTRNLSGQGGAWLKEGKRMEGRGKGGGRGGGEAVKQEAQFDIPTSVGRGQNT